MVKGQLWQRAHENSYLHNNQSKNGLEVWLKQYPSSTKKKKKKKKKKNLSWRATEFVKGKTKS
jgi:hypothetical protein